LGAEPIVPNGTARVLILSLEQVQSCYTYDRISLHHSLIPSSPGILHAYDATNLDNELYNSSQNTARDQFDSCTKFSVPTIANGEVFIKTQTSLSIYGLLGTVPPTPTPGDGSFNPNAHYQVGEHEQRLLATIIEL
jgi:hypothetical protein